MYCSNAKEKKKNPFNLFCYVYSMYKCKYDHIGLKTFACMYTVASLEECIEKYFYLKLLLPAAWKVHGGPCASVRWQKKCLKSGQFKKQQYSTSGHDFCCGILALWKNVLQIKRVWGKKEKQKHKTTFKTWSTHTTITSHVSSGLHFA